MTATSADYDHPWKAALEQYFEQFLAFFFPEAHTIVDWSRPYETLDKELQQVVRDAELGQRQADKLFKVWQHNGDEAWVLIHVEVQSQRETGFAQRMFVYNYRIFDCYRQPVISLAVLGDSDPDWRPCSYEYSLGGCQVSIQFPIVKLLDYESQWDTLEQSLNPFAVMVMAHLRTKATTGNPEGRAKWKWQLVRGLYERGYDKTDILELFRLVDWMMTLPEDLQLAFEDQIKQYREEEKMPLLSKMEIRAQDKGQQLGEVKMARELALKVLETRFGQIPAPCADSLDSIDDLILLKQLFQDAMAVESVSAFQQVLTQLAAPKAEETDLG